MSKLLLWLAAIGLGGLTGLVIYLAMTEDREDAAEAAWQEHRDSCSGCRGDPITTLEHFNALYPVLVRA